MMLLLRWSFLFLMIQLVFVASIQHGQKMGGEVFAETGKSEMVLCSIAPIEKISGTPESARPFDQTSMDDDAAPPPAGAPNSETETGGAKSEAKPETPSKRHGRKDVGISAANMIRDGGHETAYSRPESRTQAPFHSLIAKAADRHGLDPALIKAIIMAESGFNPKAVSSKGAKGLMQLMPGTAKAMGVNNIFDPEENIFGGVRYFKNLVNIFDGDIKLALAAYNAGMKRVKHYKGIPPFKVTRSYIKKVIEYHRLYKEKKMEATGKNHVGGQI